MLDADLAEIYGYETKNFNRQVKNNIEKFEGEDFMFQLTDEEILELSRAARDNTQVTVFSDNVRNKDMLTKNILNDFRKDYPNIDMKLKIAGKAYHDRYIVWWNVKQ